MQNIDAGRRRLLKLTLGGGTAFATPLMLSYSLEGWANDSDAPEATTCDGSSDQV